ncbi:MAG: gliding motility-associated C-terminal domain-containing protein, partial [Bacteroidota bacterium]
NTTGNAIDLLGNYTLEIYFNGSIDPRLYPLKGVIAANGTHILCNPLDGLIGDQNIAAAHSGNDAVAIATSDGIIVDVFGAIGCDPGSSGWSVAGGSSVDVTLRRKPCVNRGVTGSGGCGFPNPNEWEAFPVNTTSGLGSHNFGLSQKVEIMGNNALCENPSISLEATEGFVRYQWSNGRTERIITVDAPGTYTVVAETAQGCIASDAKQINGRSPEIFAAIDDIQPVSCRPKKDGSVTVNPSGGSGGFSYAWETGTGTSRTITGLGAGTYNITVSDQNGCAITVSAKVDGLVTVPLGIERRGETCTGRKDGRIVLSAQGTNLMYSIDDMNFSSQTTYTDLAPSEYFVTVRNEDGCGDEKRVLITAGTQFNLRQSIVEQAKCQGEGGGQIFLRPEGGAEPYSISFDGGPFVANNLVHSDLKGATYEIIIRDASGCEKTFQQEIELGSDLVVKNPIPTPATCKGIDDGSVQIETEGGTGPISFYLTEEDGTLKSNIPNFRPEFTGLGVGQHFMIARDSFDCRISVDFTIAEKEPLQTDLLGPILCTGDDSKGVVTVLPQTGVAPYLYRLDTNTFTSNNRFTDLDSTAYQFTTVDARGCINIDSVDFVGVTGFEIAFVRPKDESCPNTNDGQITIATNSNDTVLYSIDGINFSENNIFSGLSPKTYTIYAQSSGCQDTATATILPASPLGLIGIDPKISKCDGDTDGELAVMVTGGQRPYAYQLNDGPFQTDSVFTNLIANTYTVTVRDSNLCEQIFPSVILPGPTRLDVECKVVQQVISPEDTSGQVEIIIFGGASPYNVQLVDAGFNNRISLDGLATFGALSAGNYQVEVTDANNCVASCSFSIMPPDCDMIPKDTISRNRLTCDPASVGIFRTEEKGADGCMDIISTTFSLAPKDTTDLEATTCDPAQVGTTPTLLTNRFGCDSLVRTNFRLIRSDTTYLRQASCQVDAIGTERLTLQNAVGCDSILVIETTLDQTIKETFVTDETCDITQVGIDTVTIKTLAGCDSLIITRIVIAASEPTKLTATTCDAANVRIDTFALTNQFGCDSLVIVNTTLAESHFLPLVEETCTPQDTGLTTQFLTNQFGCDSIVVIQTNLMDINTCSIGFVARADTICWDALMGIIQIDVEVGKPPFAFFVVNDISGDTLQKGVMEDKSQQIIDIPLGQYGVTIVNENGITQMESVEVIRSEQMDIQAIISDYNGFGVSCTGAQDGSIKLLVDNGQAPYTYQWETGERAHNLQNLTVGNYSVTVMDAVGCSNSTSFELEASRSLDIEVQIASPACSEDVVGRLTIYDVPNRNGQLEYSLDGTFFQPVEKLPFIIDKLAPAEYQLFMQDENDCQTNTSFVIPRPEERQLNLVGEKALALGDSLVLTPEADFAIQRYAWSADVPVNCPDCSTFVGLPTLAGTYTLTAFDENDCPVTASVDITIDRTNLVYLPNIFSPNGDGVNDVYQIFMDQSVTRLNSLRIFDYEGRLMYQVDNRQRNDATIGWDGWFNGQQMLPAVFVVMAEVELIDGT